MVDWSFISCSVVRYSVLWASSVSAVLSLALPESWGLFVFFGGILGLLLGFASDRASLDGSVGSITENSNAAIALAGDEVQIAGSAQSPSIKALFFGIGLLSISLGSIVVTMVAT